MVDFDKNEVEKVLREIEHPEIAHTLFELGMISDIKIEEDKVSLTLKVPMLGIPIKDYLIANIRDTLKKEYEDLDVEVEVEEMAEEEKAKFIHMAQEGWRG